MKYLDIKDIIQKLIMVNKDIRLIVIENNYILFKSFLKHLHLNSRMKRSDILLRSNHILTFLQSNLSKMHLGEPKDLHPFLFEADGGTYNDDYHYFLQNIFSNSGVCHSTKVPTNANI
jgi:hypothetical protein